MGGRSTKFAVLATGFLGASVLAGAVVFAADSDPAPGSTVLERIFSEHGFPTSVNDLANPKAATNPGYVVSDSLRIPDSRSLQRDQVDCKNPRTILSLRPVQIRKPDDEESGEKKTGARRTRPRLPSAVTDPLAPPNFIGHAEKPHQAEMISWNPTARPPRYEFLIVSDIEDGKTPKIAPANRSVCVACHQNEGPIFSHFPWSETTFNQKIQEKIRKCQDEAGIAEVQTQNGGFSFDGDVRLANKLVQAGRVCSNLCGVDLKCRRALLVQATASASGSVGSGIAVDSSKAVDPILKHLKEKDFRYPSSVLPDRDPTVFPDKNGQTTVFVDEKDNRIFFPPSDLHENPTYNELQSTSVLPLLLDPSNPQGGPSPFGGGGIGIGGGLGSGTQISKSKALKFFGIQSLADPRAARPKVSPLMEDVVKAVSDPAQAALVTGLQRTTLSLLGSVCFGFTSDDVTKIVANSQQDAIEQAQNDPRLDQILSVWPPTPGSSKEIMKVLSSPPTIRSATRDDLDAINCILAKTEESRPMAKESAEIASLQAEIHASLNPGPVNRERALASFQKYCTECHTPEAAEMYGSPVLRFDSLESLKHQGKPGWIEHALVNRIMPKKDAKIQPTPDERVEMIRALSETR